MRDCSIIKTDADKRKRSEIIIIFMKGGTNNEDDGTVQLLEGQT